MVSDMYGFVSGIKSGPAEGMPDTRPMESDMYGFVSDIKSGPADGMPDTRPMDGGTSGEFRMLLVLELEEVLSGIRQIVPLW